MVSALSKLDENVLAGGGGHMAAHQRAGRPRGKSAHGAGKTPSPARGRHGGLGGYDETVDAHGDDGP